MTEFLAGVQPFIQPSPVRNTGGDCFACAMAAALRHLFPEKPPTFDQAFELYRNENGVLSNTWPGIDRALQRAHAQGYPTQTKAEIALARVDAERWSYGYCSLVDEGYHYAELLEGYLRSGWIAFIEMRHDPSPPIDAEGRLRAIDHVALLDGVRWIWEEHDLPGGGRSKGLECYLHVVCSSKGAYWEKPQRLVRMHGIGAWWLVRRYPDREG